MREERARVVSRFLFVFSSKMLRWIDGWRSVTGGGTLFPFSNRLLERNLAKFSGINTPLRHRGIGSEDRREKEGEGDDEKGRMSEGGGTRSGKGAIENVDSLIGSDIVDDIIHRRPIREKVNLVSRSKKSWEERVSALFSFLGKPIPSSPSVLPLTVQEMEAVLSTPDIEVTVLAPSSSLLVPFFLTLFLSIYLSFYLSNICKLIYLFRPLSFSLSSEGGAFSLRLCELSHGSVLRKESVFSWADRVLKRLFESVWILWNPPIP